MGFHEKKKKPYEKEKWKECSNPCIGGKPGDKNWNQLYNTTKFRKQK